MRFYSNGFLDKYYNFWVRVINFKSKARLIPIDFHKPWFQVVWGQKWYAVVVICGDVITNMFNTLMPIILGYVIGQKKFSYFLGVMLFAVAVQICDYFVYVCLCIVESQSVHSIYHNAHNFFLTVDPIYHTMQKRGKILGKIDRSSRSFEFLLDVFRYEFFPVVVGILSAIISCMYYSFILGFIAIAFCLVTMVVNTVLQYLSTITFEKKIIETEDIVREVSTENLVQNPLIRACFASNDLDRKLRLRNSTMMIVEGTSGIAFQAVAIITKLFYLGSVCTVGVVALQFVFNGSMTIIQATSLLVTYIIGTQDIVHIGRSVRYMLRYSTRIEDLFYFIRAFGKQTFPVLSTDLNKKELDAIVIEKPPVDIAIDVNGVTFNYSKKTKIFENHSMHLSISCKQDDKLYGIIGPSGIGKTTFLALLGGQIKPTVGSVTINGIDIYAIDDYKRRELITLQGQVASSLSGNVKSALLLGLPQESPPYTHEELISALSHVGLWSMFKDKGGLEEGVGEGGMNLSGGQRQRLNFASLYLRAKFFKPFLILIDEPTSSLDEVSERAITRMIDELAHDSVTFVIAHRLKTLEKAMGILDFSLMKTEKELAFYDKETLLKKSTYYKKLVAGEVNLER